ncbi:MAG: methyltransferase family protein [Wenzhouxiangella sp.]
MPGPLHFHWCLKVLIGFALIGHFVLLSLSPGVLPPWFSVPYPVFLALVLVGGGCAIWHHLIMKRARRRAAGRPVLVCSGAGFDRVRHPIYLGDLILYTGFAVYPATVVSLGLLLIAVWAIWRQAVREDGEMAASFGEQHAAWRARTGRLWPAVWAGSKAGGR